MYAIRVGPLVAARCESSGGVYENAAETDVGLGASAAGRTGLALSWGRDPGLRGSALDAPACYHAAGTPRKRPEAAAPCSTATFSKEASYCSGVIIVEQILRAPIDERD